MRTPGRWMLPLAAAALLVAAYSFAVFPANLVMLVPVLVDLERRAADGAKARLGASLRFTVPAYAVLLHWVWAMLWISWLASLMWLGLVILFAVPNALALTVAAWLRRTLRAGWGWVLPVCWLPVEWARSFGDLRMTADHVAHSMAKYPFLVQFADVVGPYGVGAAVLACNGLVADLIVGGPRRKRVAAVALVAVLGTTLAYDAWAWRHWDRPGETVRVGIVQPNIPIGEKNDESLAVEQWRVLNRLTFEAAERDARLIVWPESARPDPLYQWLDRPETYRMPEISIVARSFGVSMLVGSEYGRVRSDDDWDFYNAAFAIHADGTLDPNWTAKQYLVPFVEGVPFERLLGKLLVDRGGEWHWLSGGFLPGPSSTTLPYEFGDVGVLICFEQLFPDLPRELALAGADLQVVLTNDAWWGRTVFQGYQRDVLRMRAIENRTSFVRAANTGISGFVDRRGRYTVEGPLFEEAVFVDDVALRDPGETIYTRTGDVAAWIATAAALAAIALARRREASKPPTLPAGSGPGGG